MLPSSLAWGKFHLIEDLSRADEVFNDFELSYYSALLCIIMTREDGSKLTREQCFNNAEMISGQFGIGWWQGESYWMVDNNHQHER